MTDDTPNSPQPEKRVYKKTPPATPAVQAWLDGEQTRDQLGTPDEQETAELWARINSEAETLRHRHTPIHVQSKIMNSLTDLPAVDIPDAETKKMSSGAMIGIAVLILAVGAAIGFMLVR